MVHFIKGIYQLCPTTNGRNRLGRKKSKVAKNWFDIRSEEARWETSGDVVWRSSVFCVGWTFWAAWVRVWRWWMASYILGSGEWLMTACLPWEWTQNKIPLGGIIFHVKWLGRRRLHEYWKNNKRIKIVEVFWLDQILLVTHCTGYWLGICKLFLHGSIAILNALMKGSGGCFVVQLQNTPQ